MKYCTAIRISGPLQEQQNNSTAARAKHWGALPWPMAWSVQKELIQSKQTNIVVPRTVFRERAIQPPIQ